MALRKRRNRSLVGAALLVSLALAGCGGKKTQAPDLTTSAEPDKVLFERALDDIQKGRHTVGRLTLQTLINTYPDSEYLAKAKLAIADSYFKEGGTAGLTQAVAEYKDFITFFPFLDEAPYAQLQIAMAHFRRMEKPDRDRTHARLAEEELQQFLLKYPDHTLAVQAEQRLREVQEVLAEGDYRIARYYYIKGSMRAAGGRLLEMVDRYPLYSQADKSLWMLGDIYERAERGDVAARFYSRIVTDCPLSEHAENAKGRLIALGVPVPQPKPEALERMQRERELSREKAGIFRRSLGMFKTGPDVTMAARTGKPNLSPPPEATAQTDTLRPAGSTTGGGSSTIVVETSPTPAGNSAAAGNAGSSAPPAKADKDKKKKEDEDKKKKEEEEKKKQESSSKKKKGLRRIIPW